MDRRGESVKVTRCDMCGRVVEAGESYCFRMEEEGPAIYANGERVGSWFEYDMCAECAAEVFKTIDRLKAAKEGQDVQGAD